jgi:hypothetical protein
MLCLAGVEHIALEPVHHGSHSISHGLMLERETITSTTFTETTHRINNELCSDIRLLTDILAGRMFLADQVTCNVRMLVSSPIKNSSGWQC